MTKKSPFKAKDFTPSYIHFLLFFILLLSSQMDFGNSEATTGTRIDLQVLVRLGVVLFFALAACWDWRRFIVLCRQAPLWLHLTFLIYIAAVSASVDTLTFYTYYALAIHLAMCITIVVMMDRFGINNMIFYYFISIAIFCTVSLVFYYLVPGMGKYTYWQNGVLYESSRLKGLAGHPNTLGFMGATGLIAAFHTYFRRYPVSKLIYALAIIILYSLILTNSRSSLAFMVVTLLIYVLVHSRSVIFSTPLISVIAVSIVLGFQFFRGQMLAMLGIFSRSGSPDEIAGAANTWDIVANLIQKKPIFGWGHANLDAVLFQRAGEAGFTVGQAHNIYLQTAFAGGLIGLTILLLCMLAMMIFATMRTYKYQFPFDFCIVLYILFAGLTESIILTTTSGNYLVFMMAVASTTLYCERTQQQKQMGKKKRMPQSATIAENNGT